jgi:hypothetical protein
MSLGNLLSKVAQMLGFGSHTAASKSIFARDMHFRGYYEVMCFEHCDAISGRTRSPSDKGPSRKLDFPHNQERSVVDLGSSLPSLDL